MSTENIPQIINFLCQDLNLPQESVRLALKQTHSSHGTLPIVLWQYGLVTLPQLDRVFELFESYSC
ncbi:DUF2949 domain-containing protein [Chamaesiphon sp. GL140_3_metabinner_50]|uniref:DUF2949 domain-containing protein n=1 Tax=Chamaesiphon sp. GL140_3_metabinner_50 TaxID=2970812 RepID=UPI0025E06DE8|nr:DUF2949 domain-containing protein [Chamaesiphon sp. GL140_3_metabinner_50]